MSIYDGNVYRNGVQLEEDYTLEGYTTGELYDYVVPENEVFVMGDNRSVSLDSRSAEVGAVSEDDIIGKAFFRLYPFSEIGFAVDFSSLEVGEWGKAGKTGRSGAISGYMIFDRRIIVWSENGALSDSLL